MGCAGRRPVPRREKFLLWRSTSGTEAGLFPFAGEGVLLCSAALPYGKSGNSGRHGKKMKEESDDRAHRFGRGDPQEERVAGARLFPSFLGGRRRLQRVCSGAQYGGRHDGKREAGHSPAAPCIAPTTGMGGCGLRGGSGDRRRGKPVFGSAEDCVRAGGVLQCGVKGVDQRAQASTHRYADRQIPPPPCFCVSFYPCCGADSSPF